MAKAKLFNETVLNRVFKAKDREICVGIDQEEECIYLTNNYCILKVSRNVANYHLKHDGKIMGFIIRADNLLQGESGVVRFDNPTSQGTKSHSVNLDMLKKHIEVKEEGKSVARYTGLKFSNNEKTYYLVQYEEKEGKYGYGAFDAEMVDIFSNEFVIENASFYDGTFGPLKYADEQGAIEYLQLPIRFDHIRSGLGDFLK